MPAQTPSNPAAEFIRRWQASGAAERANYGMFLTELCDLLGVPRPEPTRPDDRDNAYVFERVVHMDDGDGQTTEEMLNAEVGGAADCRFEIAALTGRRMNRGNCEVIIESQQPRSLF